MSPARVAAFDILRRVEAGAYASDLLLARGPSLDSRDAGLASEIIFGVLRFRAQLDFLITHYSHRDPFRFDPEVRLSLEMGIYQLRYLDRVPAHAAVAESVELVKHAHKRSAAGLVNAVLRKVKRTRVDWPDRATALSMPAWLLERWDRQFGVETAGRIATDFLRAPHTYVRVPHGADPPPGAKPTEIPGCFRVAGAVEGLRCQDIGSQSIVPLLALEPGQAFLDVCAAPGNKTMQALETPLRAVACELHFQRAQGLLDARCPVVVLDATRPLPFRTRFDRVLVDAPCSGTGTIGRNPEIKWRLRAEDIDALAAKQKLLLANALDLLAPGGRLVYSTCSLEREENEDVVASVLEARPGLRLLEQKRRTPGLEAGDGFFAAIITAETLS